MKLSIVILSWNSKDYLLRCLQSLQACSVQHREIIVVDNNSQDGSRELLELLQRRGELCTILNSSNQGVGPARNQGFCLARGEYLLSIDVDTQVKPGAIEKLLEGMESDARMGLCAPRLEGPRGERQYTCGEFPTLQSKLVRQLPSSLHLFMLRKSRLHNRDQQGLRYVGWVTGACQMIRAAALKEVGMYDPRIFYGPEDVDLCLRMWLRGWRVLYNGDAVVTHEEQHITKKWRMLFSRTTRAHVRGLAYYFWKHRYLFRPPCTQSKHKATLDPIPLRPGPAPTSRGDLGGGPAINH